MSYKLYPSPITAKKFRVDFPDGRHIDFGASGYSDYPTHKDYDRMLRYLNRHQAREDWTLSGIQTAGFWARWILWNKPNIYDSISDTEHQFNIKIDANIPSNYK